MRTILILFLTSLFFASCGSENNDSVSGLIASGDMQAIKAKKTELSQKQKELKAEIDSLNAYIQKKEQKQKATLVTTKKINDTVFKHFVEVQGNVETDKNIILYPQFSGILTRINVQEGKRVSKGQLLAVIDDGGLRNQLAQQETQAALAKTTFERQQRLWDQKIGSEIQFLEAKARYESAESAIQQLRSQVARTTITAPFSGVIDEIIADQGQVVNQGQTPVMRLVNLSDMYVKASIPENYIENVQVGTEVIVNLPSIGKEYQGTVKQVGNYINPDNRNFDVQIAIPNKEGLVKPNLIASVKVNDYTSNGALIIPENILQENSSGETIAYLYEPVNDSTGAAKRITLEIGKNYNNRVEVKEGLKSGDIIIIEGAKTIRDGEKVTTRTE